MRGGMREKERILETTKDDDASERLAQILLTKYSDYAHVSNKMRSIERKHAYRQQLFFEFGAHDNAVENRNGTALRMRSGCFKITMVWAERKYPKERAKMIRVEILG